MLSYPIFIFRYLKLLIRRKDTLFSLIEKQSRRRPDNLCIKYKDEVITYVQFHLQCIKVAKTLLKHGVKEGDRVSVMLPNCPEYLRILGGASAIGAVVANINTNLKHGPLKHCIEISECKLAVVSADYKEDFDTALRSTNISNKVNVFIYRHDGSEADPIDDEVVGADWLKAKHDAANQVFTRASQNSDMPLCLIYTSGTTGVPKAARILNLRWTLGGIVVRYVMSLKDNDTVLCPLPMYHSNAVILALSGVINSGACLAISPKFSITSFWDEAIDYEATAFIYIGEILRYLLTAAPHNKEHKHQIKRILGNGLRPDIWDDVVKRFGIKMIHEFYASTEGNAVMFNVNGVAGSVGTPLLKYGHNLLIVRYDFSRGEYARNDDGFCIPCRDGEHGELLGKIKFTTPYAGYTNAADTDKTIAKDVLKKGDAYFKTGDLMYKSKDGNYFFVDRLGDTFRWKGENVSTTEVGEVIMCLPEFEIATVYGVQIPGYDGRCGMAAVIMQSDTQFDPALTYSYVSEQLPSYAVPVFIRICDELELTGTYKLVKVRLQEEGYAQGGNVWVADHKAKTYLPLDAELRKNMDSGKIKF